MPDAAEIRFDDDTHFDRLERVDRSLRDGHLLVPEEEVIVYRKGLEWLASLRSGKNGATVSRHVLEVVEDQTSVPPALAAGSATVAAAGLCTWLEVLRIEREEDFFWLLEKWIYASERERGRMLLAGDAEVERAKRMEGAVHVRMDVTYAKIAKRDQEGGTKAVPRMRIKCLDARAKAITRDTTAVRWVMTYVAAKWGRDERISDHVTGTSPT